MQLHTLKPTTKRDTKKRIGRGGKRGKTSGRGTKGQRARSGGAPRPEMRDVIKRIPKLRGHGINRAQTVIGGKEKVQAVNVGVLEKMEGTEVSPKILLAQGFVSRAKGKTPQVKILGSGELSKKISVKNCAVSASAREKIEKVGGEIL
ncbi:MAG: uL15 family ribosomal protein [Candidatus Paceibacterota bacterium]